MANLWHPLGAVFITDIGEKRILFRFFCEVDRDRVVKGSPWTFNNHLLIIVILKEGEDPMEVPLNKANFWVQIHDLLSSSFIEYDTKAIIAGHGESFCSIRMDHGSKELPMGWDISLRALPRRAMVGESPWLRDSITDWGVMARASGSNPRSDFRNQHIPNLMCIYEANLGLNVMGKSFSP
ncbi:hypothetical protein J1N35_044808 [Gossypium stocksii]|uniref:DUF4283 domain-containing protein n=1 Tax=Gossypium stocksii TaxID=47602 RepID=A0A9D3U9Y3_9ROSI|nr:hypothetical protein J1N35_044808 [Gossypium stocksii]